MHPRNSHQDHWYGDVYEEAAYVELVLDLIDALVPGAVVSALVVWVFDLDVPGGVLTVGGRDVVGQRGCISGTVCACALVDYFAVATDQTHALAVAGHNRRRKIAGVGPSGVVRAVKAAAAFQPSSGDVLIADL